MERKRVHSMRQEIKEFFELGQQFLSKKCSAMEFKKKSGGLGVYAERDQTHFMIRLRIPSGILSVEQMELIVRLCEQYHCGTIHLTTRQAIQLHHLSLEDVCEIMDLAWSNGLMTRGGGGDFPRNIALSVLSGVEKGEAFDVTPYAKLAGEYCMSQMEQYHLPRKLKIAFSSSPSDLANAKVNDLGFLAVEKDGQPYFRLFLAGGLGRNPEIGLEWEELVAPEEVLYYIEALIQVFIAEGNYENRAKARLRYIPKRMGIEAFFSCYREKLQEVKQTQTLQKVSVAHLQEKTYQKETMIPTEQEKEFLIEQKQEGYYTLELQPFCGQLSLDAFQSLLGFMQKNQLQEVRLSMQESVYVRDLTAKMARELLQMVRPLVQKVKMGHHIACIGVPTCQIGIQKSQALLQKIQETFQKEGISLEKLPDIAISGCGNSCARHQIEEIGFEGCKKNIEGKMEDAFLCYVGGACDETGAKFGEIVSAMQATVIPSFLIDLVKQLERYDRTFAQFQKEHASEFLALCKAYSI